MSSIRKLHGKWNVQIRRKGFRQITKSFIHRRDATQFAREQEGNLDKLHLKSNDEITTLKSLILRYIDEVSCNKAGHYNEKNILMNFLSRVSWANDNINLIKGFHFSRYRDQRLTKVSAGTLCRELDVLRHVYSWSIKELGLDIQNVVANIKRPRLNNCRERTLTDKELNWLIDTAKQPLKNIIIIGYECCLRRSEILRVQKEDIKGFVLNVPLTKNGHQRDVPLTLRAMKVLKNSSLPFKLSASRVTHAFQSLCIQGGIEDCRFHDIRHTCVSRWAKILNPNELRIVSGHKSLNQLSRYVNLKAKDLVSKINFNEQGKLRRIK